MAGMIVLFQGRRGSGKTLSMTFWSTYFKRLGWDIKSNYSLKGVEKFDQDFLYSLSKDSDIKNCVLLIDELQLFFDSRLFKSGKSISFSHFIQQLRKRNIIILGTTQYIDTIEKRIRQHTDLLVKPKFDKKSQICTNTIYDITSLEDSNIPEHYTLSFYAPNIYTKYDTNEIL